MTGPEFAAARVGLGYTQPELAERWEVSERTITRLERAGTVVPRKYELLIRAADGAAHHDWTGDDVEKEQGHH